MTTDDELFRLLALRMGEDHAGQRWRLENEHEAVFGHGINFFHPENWYSTHALFRGLLKVTGLYQRGHRNSTQIQVRSNVIALERLPEAFRGFTILHISDMHADMNPVPMQRLAEMLPGLEYDVCVLTGDFRAQTFGPFEQSLELLRLVRGQMRSPVFSVLGNHDSIRMLPLLEAMDIQVLLNEAQPILRGKDRIYFAGVDDAHYYRADNLEKAASAVSLESVAILLSHTPEIYRQAARAGFDAMLCGHTHGGQICLPGGTPITLDSSLPRAFGKGAWKYADMSGYTSVGVGTCIVPVRFNCAPEITLHRLDRPAN